MKIEPSAAISEMSFSGGQTYCFKADEKIIIVGPNNSGKSQTLREIISIVSSDQPFCGEVVVDLKLKKTGTIEDLEAYLSEKGELIGESYRLKNWSLRAEIIQHWLHPYLVYGIAGGFIKNIAAENRLTICHQQQSISFGDPKTMPQHVLYEDEVLMQRTSELFRRAFGKDLFL